MMVGETKRKAESSEFPFSLESLALQGGEEVS